MPWPKICAHCGGGNVAAAVHELFCYDCGHLTDANGSPVPHEDQYGPDNKNEE